MIVRLFIWLSLLCGVVLAQTSTRSHTCEQVPQHRQFDFWLGDWDVTEAGKIIAQSSIQKIVGSCVIYENYSQGDGYSGKSFNVYDSVLQKWRQTWVDSLGNVSEFIGEWKDSAMCYEGASHRQNGRKILRKMTLTPIGNDKVRQYSEYSPDEGKTWKLLYDYLYLRKK